jgi:small subunit ribosomal protein S14
MAKKSILERQLKRSKIVQRYAKKRAELKRIIADSNSTSDERQSALVRLQKLPRNASPVRLRNRCAITGRSKGYYRKFGLARTKLREATMQGNIPGLRKASW